MTPDRTADEEFLAAYDPRAYDPVAVTIDVVALTIRDGALHVLLVSAASRPRGLWALPGGFVRNLRDGPRGVAREEDLDEAAARELAEETGLRADRPPARPRPPGAARRVRRRPGRDPRMRVVSVAYLAFAPGPARPGRPAADAGDAPAWAPARTAAGTTRRWPSTTRASSPTGWSGPAPSWSTPRWPRRSPRRSSPSPSCGRSTRRSGARRCTPGTSTARCCRCPGFVGEHRRDHRTRRPARRPAGPALPRGRRAAAAPGPAASGARGGRAMTVFHDDARRVRLIEAARRPATCSEPRRGRAGRAAPTGGWPRLVHPDATPAPEGPTHVSTCLPVRGLSETPRRGGTRSVRRVTVTTRRRAYALGETRRGDIANLYRTVTPRTEASAAAQDPARPG